jgi:hypothetical protein
MQHAVNEVFHRFYRLLEAFGPAGQARAVEKRLSVSLASSGQRVEGRCERHELRPRWASIKDRGTIRSWLYVTSSCKR